MKIVKRVDPKISHHKEKFMSSYAAHLELALYCASVISIKFRHTHTE